MKDYNFLISDDRLHKSGLTKTLLIKSGVGAKGGLEQFWNMRGWGGLAKETGDVFKGGGGSFAGTHYALLTSTHCTKKYSMKAT